jgi:hypothetical protein
VLKIIGGVILGGLGIAVAIVGFLRRRRAARRQAQEAWPSG